LPAALWAALLLYIGGRSNVLTVETSLPVDKVAHFFMYGVLGALVTVGWLKRPAKGRLVWLLVLAMLVGAADEIQQRSVPRRSSDVKDWLADALGITVAATLVLRYKNQDSSNVV